MKTFLLLPTIFLLTRRLLFAQVAINSDNSAPRPSAMLDVKSTNSGFLAPRMTQAQRDAIVAPEEGLIVICTNCGIVNPATLCIFVNGSWRMLTGYCTTPIAPVAGTHNTTMTSIAWNWNPVANAIGYKWGTTNNSTTATDMGMATTKTENGLTCNTVYTRYVWAYNDCGLSPLLLTSNSTSTISPASPTAGTHIPGITQVVWNWNAVSGAVGYKWNTINNYASAIDLGSSISKTETGLTCNTVCIRYIWAYGSCGNSSSTSITDTTLMDPPASPTAGVHVASVTQVIWKWNATAGASGYKWNTTNNYATATDMGSALSKTETGLSCNTPYTRYIWSYNSCGYLPAVVLNQSTQPVPPASPTAGTNTRYQTQITWNWNTVTGATGYKWNITDSYATATDMGTATTKTETGLLCDSTYTRFIWAYGGCGNSVATAMVDSTLLCWFCGISTITINHATIGGVAPVNKTTTYGTVTNIPGEPAKCWITSNLGSDHQATVVNDATEASAGWYWQFNRKQGYKSAGSPIPGWTITAISESSDWLPANDPCQLELGIQWRLPSYTEWDHVNNFGGWTNWNGPWNSGLKLHTAGYLSDISGSSTARGVHGYYWSSTQNTYSNGWDKEFNSTYSSMGSNKKAYGFSVRCLKE